MEAEAEQVFSTQQAAAAVGVGAAMLRRYAQTLERLTGTDIPHTRRDGRQFSARHINSFQQARALIDGNTGLSVEAALRAVLAGSTTDVIPASAPSSTLDTTALADALRDVITEPLVAELRELRQEVRELGDLRAEVVGLRQDLAARPPAPPELPQATPQADPEVAGRAPGGPLVRVAVRLERLLSRLRGQ